jgi:SAM-dependent methyltransferase
VHGDQQRVLEINKKQAEFYDVFHTNDAFNLPSKLWRRFRGRVRAMSNVDDRVDEFERAAFSAAMPRRVLEVGCYCGRAQTDWLLRSLPGGSKSYVGIELSKGAIDRFRERIAAEDATKVELVVGDFLIHEFPPASFDAVYMHSVFHHFPDPGMAIQRIKAVLAPGGSFITFDPLLTNPLFRAARMVYRPFQSDREWEWPLRQDVFRALENDFVLRRVQGFLGMEMYGAMLCLALPSRLTAAVRQWGRSADLKAADRLGSGLYRCNSVAMWWQSPA